MTKYAKRILEIVNSSYCHPTAEQIFLEMKKNHPKVVLATVYNNLNQLVADRMVRKIVMEGSPDRYDRIDDRHDHLICSRCGKISDMKFCDYSKDIEDKLGESILSYDLKVYYTCEGCRQ